MLTASARGRRSARGAAGGRRGRRRRGRPRSPASTPSPMPPTSSPARSTARFGGFGGAPKFPRPSELLLLLRAWQPRPGRRDDLRDMVVATLGAMARGGMRDHIGGGFHRYSVDERWRVPHFEKMLYDQAQLVLALIEASQAAADPLLAAVADDTLVYVDRDLSDAGGGFYSAEDADSIPPEAAGQPGAHASEGAFYIWPQREIETLLGEADARDRGAALRPRAGRQRAVRSAAGVHRQEPALHGGDVRGHRGPRRPAGRRRRRRRRARPAGAARGAQPPAASVARRQGADVVERPDDRGDGPRRPDPRRPRDPARGAHWIDRAARAARFVRTALWQPDTQTLHRRWRAGEAGIDGYCEDYAGIVWGCLELLQATGDPCLAASGPASCRRRRIACSGTRPAPAGSTPRAATRRCCSVSRRSTTAPSRRRARSRCAT